jgi:hypothetical protein
MAGETEDVPVTAEAFGTWLMQYQADPTQPEVRSNGR